MNINTVMIIEDSKADQYLSEAIITKFDDKIEILKAYDGQEALDILNNRPQQPDIIFLDINMPRMNGHEFLAEYEKSKGQATIIIMLTSSDQEIDKEKSLAHKCVKKYLSKPLKLENLQDILKNVN